ncbi:hypothetical protein ACFSVJ_06180 [Prauserella oleivorans]
MCGHGLGGAIRMRLRGRRRAGLRVGLLLSRSRHARSGGRGDDVGQVNGSLFPRTELAGEHGTGLTARAGVSLFGRAGVVQARDGFGRLADAFLDVRELQPQPGGEGVEVVPRHVVQRVAQHPACRFGGAVALQDPRRESQAQPAGGSDGSGTLGRVQQWLRDLQGELTLPAIEQRAHEFQDEPDPGETAVGVRILQVVEEPDAGAGRVRRTHHVAVPAPVSGYADPDERPGDELVVDAEGVVAGDDAIALQEHSVEFRFAPERAETADQVAQRRRPLDRREARDRQHRAEDGQPGQGRADTARAHGEVRP